VRRALIEHRIDRLPNGRIDPRLADRAWANRSIPKTDESGGKADSSRLEQLVGERAMREGVRRRIDEHRLNLVTGITVLRQPILDAATEAARKMDERMRALAHRLGPIVAAIADPGECVRVIEAELLQISSALRKPIELLAPGEGTPAAEAFTGPPMPPMPPSVRVVRGRVGR
jgi:hypothetical protein